MSKVFCSIRKPVVANPPMASHVLKEDQFAKGIRVVGKNCKLAVFLLMKKLKKIMKVREIIMRMRKFI